MSLPHLPPDLPPYREAMARGDWSRAVRLLETRTGAKAHTPEEELLLADLQRLRGDYDRALSILKRLRSRPEPPVAVRASLQLALLQLGMAGGSLEEASKLVREASSLAGDDKRLRGLVAHVESKVHWRRSEIREAGRRLEEARRLLEESGEEEELAKVYDALGMFHEHSGERERALSFYSLSLSKKAQWRDLYGLGITLGNLGRFHLNNKEPELALSYLRDDLRIAESMGDLRAQVILKINVGQALTECNRPAEARDLLEEALSVARKEGWRQREAYALKDLARAVALAGEPDRAFVLLETALSILPEDPPSYPRGQVYLRQGEMFLEFGEEDGEEFSERAREAFEKARKIFVAVGATREESLAIHGLARIAERQKEWNTCVHHLEQGMSLLGRGAATAVIPFEEMLRNIMASSREEAVPTTIGPYRILARLGAGGFAEVFKGFDSREDASREDVAIKVLRLEGIADEREREERRARFQREYRILSSVSHPNVVRLIDAGEDPIPYLVEEFLEGGDLTALVGHQRSLPLDRAVSIAKGILAGLSVLHEKGIVHRDLKPPNVLLRENDQPVIVDFGVSRMLEMTALTLQSAVMGTLVYMAPEQLRGETVDHRADIYSFGALFFELLSGRIPHEGNSIGEIMRRVEDEEPLDLARLRKTVPPELTRCVLTCLEKNPDGRYPSAAAVLADLEKASVGM